jgi:hypothetical protein
MCGSCIRATKLKVIILHVLSTILRTVILQNEAIDLKYVFLYQAIILTV